ncbi:hypothetical protein MYX75_11665 [Acidobacteria bacterium AH-259-A15]|nr:hypothetical protein [Acidobacteria bacterium AH-259-A15]
MHLEDVNERASIQRINKESPLFRFEYINNFYGSCQFVAEVVEHKNQALTLDEASLSLENYQIKKGNMQMLLNIAKIFFRRVLGKYMYLAQLERGLPNH